MSCSPEVRRSRQWNLVGGSGLLFGGRIAVAVLSYASTAAIARTLSGHDWGGFTLIFSVTMLLAALFEVQAARVVLEELLDPALDAGRTVGSYMTLRLALGVAAYLAAVSFVILGDYPAPVRHGMVVGGIVLLLTPTWNGLYLYFQARHWLPTVAAAWVASRVLLLAGTVVLMAMGTRSLVVFVLPWLAAETVMLLILVVIARRHIHLRPAFEPRRWLGWLRETMPIMVGAGIGTVYFRIDAVLLSRLDDLEAVGLYGIAYKFSDLLAFLPVAVMATTFPLLVGAWPWNPTLFWRNFRGALILLTIIVFSLTAAFCVFARPLIVLLYGDRYAPASNAARLVVMGQAIACFTSFCIYTLIAVRRSVVYAAASIVGLVVNVGLNLYLIPRYSYGGAAFATMATELGVLAIVVAAVRRIPDVIRLPWPVLRRVAVGVGALIATAMAAKHFVPWPAAAALSGGTLLVVLHIIGIDGAGGLRVVPQLLQPLDSSQATVASPLDAAAKTS